MTKFHSAATQRRGLLAGAALALWLALATATAGAAEAPVRVSDDRGSVHVFERAPQRIISMLPSLTESVCALGACARLVGVDRYSDWPASVERLPRLGGLDDALVEAIVALKPDVVLASTSSRALDRLDALGLRVVRLKSDTHADVRRTLRLLAHLLGLPDADAALWSRIDRELDAAVARIPPRLRGARVYFEIGGGPYAAGAGSFIGQTLQRMGLGNIAPAELGPFPKLNPEFIVRARPDVLMGARTDMVDVAQRPGWASLPAVQARRVCGFETAAYYTLIRPGPRLGEAAGLLADCLTRTAGAS
jgi:iron complex transport system substrate-binding protein